MLKRSTLMACTVMKWLSGLLAATLALLIPLFGFNPDLLQMALESQTFVAMSGTLPAGTRYWILWAVACVPILVTIAILLNLYRLFGCFRREEVFSAGAIGALRAAGIGLITLAPVLIVARTLTVLVATVAGPPGSRTLQISIGSQDFLVLAFGLVMLVMSVAMREALRLDQENRQIV